MSRISAKKELMDFMEAHKWKYTWFKKTSLFNKFYGRSPESIGRALRELRQEGKIIREFYDGEKTKGLVKYKLADPKPTQLFDLNTLTNTNI